MTDKTDLKNLAQELANAKAAADAAKAAYDALKAAFESRPDVAQALDAKRAADAEKQRLETDARNTLADRWSQGVTVSSVYYDTQTSVEPDYNDKELVDHLVSHAPALALGLLTVDQKALTQLINANALKEEGIAGWPPYMRHAMAPVTLNVVPKPRIMWSKLPDPVEATEPATVAPTSANIQPYKWAYEMFQNDFVVLDTETTGFDGHPIEIAVIDSEGTVLFNERIKPPTGVTIHPKAQAVHGISADDLADAYTFDQVALQLKDLLNGRHVVIYNAGFDVPVIRRAYEAAGMADDTPHMTAECAMEQYAVAHGAWNDHHGSYTWVKLTEAAAAMGVTVENAHNALGDALMTLGLLKAMAKKWADSAPVPF